MRPADLSPWLALAAMLIPAALPAADVDVDDDPYLHLEEVTGDSALAWVRAQNAESAAELAGTPEFQALEARLLAIYDSDKKIPGVSKAGDHYYNFWKDAQHRRGLWRRTTLEEYRKEAPAWETVLDLASGRSSTSRGEARTPPCRASSTS
jgi:prolyl oligopeptidase